VSYPTNDLILHVKPSTAESETYVKQPLWMSLGRPSLTFEGHSHVGTWRARLVNWYPAVSFA
jgi:hypothetical protein